MRRALLAFALILFVLLAIGGCTLTTVSETTHVLPPPTRQPQTGFQVQQVTPPVPTAPVFTTPIIVTMTPTGTNALIATPVGTDLPDAQPGDQTENIVEALINRVLIPAWNFVYTFITGSIVSLWDFAGLRGGLMAQFIFCLIPGMMVTLGVLWRVFRRTR